MAAAVSVPKQLVVGVTLSCLVIAGCLNEYTGPGGSRTDWVSFSLTPCPTGPAQVGGWCQYELDSLRAIIAGINTADSSCGEMKNVLTAWLDSGKIIRWDDSTVINGNTILSGAANFDSLGQAGDWVQNGVAGARVDSIRVNIHWWGVQGAIAWDSTLRHEYGHVHANTWADSAANRYYPFCRPGNSTGPGTARARQDSSSTEELCYLEEGPASRIRAWNSGDQILKNQQACAEEESDMPTGGPEYVGICVTRYYVEQVWVTVNGQDYLVAESETELWRSCYYIELGWLIGTCQRV